ncbi:ATP-binding protein [Halodesulfovibrio marinisediminis]|uniref:AAA ATPase domain-containing protein n=1 Tax=Halodesulfovibrio marinisediminis DSM 17456 TaxID=1121457 RepID=A0A1N6JA15_9BACT|nr:ATP-binding protein [Halodesulfovibrio marinisediminis]SIO41218.1 AAA ATPase domain-containing protein [Halodesulfovibrio marinisediminis DSM 17456]
MTSKLRELTNPYDHNTHILKRREFAGRSGLLEEFENVLEGFAQERKIPNWIISGDKSIGKSSLLHQYRLLLQDYGFFVFHHEVPVSDSVCEFQFFKEVFDHIYSEVDPMEEGCLSAFQQEIWFTLTESLDAHPSSYLERELRFPTLFSSFISNNNTKLSIKSLEKDFMKVVQALSQSEYEGLVIIVDEFQELSKNNTLLSFIRQLSENIPRLSVIGAGLPSMLSCSNFDKFCRTAKSQILDGLNPSEALDLVLEPLRKKARLSRYEALSCFDKQALNEVVTRSNGNPLHIRVLCAKMFEAFSNDLALKRLTLNRAVMDSVMEYYSNISENSRRIKMALESCSFDDLSSFAYIYRYQGVGIRSILLLENAFNPLSSDVQFQTRDLFFDKFDDIYKLSLFSFKSDLLLSTIRNYSPAELASIDYSFIGDAIDNLYVSYVYEEIMGERLTIEEHSKFEDRLANKFALLLYNELLPQKIEIELIDREGVFHRLGYGCNSGVGEFVSDTKRLADIDTEKDFSSSVKEKINSITAKHSLELPAYWASLHGYCGYYAARAELTVKGKDRTVLVLCPVKEEHECKVVYDQVEDFASSINYQFDQYLLTVKSVILSWVPYRALTPILVLDRTDSYDQVEEMIRKRNFDSCAIVLEKICQWSTRLKDKIPYTHVDDVNNHGFCLMNLESFDRAKEMFDRCESKCLISKLNLAFIALRKSDYKQSKQMYKRLISRFKNDDFAKCINLAIVGQGYPIEQTVVEDVSCKNIAAWNAALVSALMQEPHHIANAILKKECALSDAEKLIRLRVSAWLAFYRGRISDAVECSSRLMEQAVEGHYLNADAQRDFQHFSKALPMGEGQLVS